MNIISKDANNHKKNIPLKNVATSLMKQLISFFPFQDEFFQPLVFLYLRNYFYFCFCFCGCLEFSFN